MFPHYLRLWTGPLPHQELFPDRRVNPLVHWIYHPAKRWLAKYWLQFLQKSFGLRVIAITGSVGKTTTKDMLYSILSLVSPTVATEKNITSTYSIPSAILKCRTSTRFLILEMGVEYPGDMTFYTWLAKPNISILTSINFAHTQFFGTLDRYSAEKLKLLTSSTLAITNSDDPNIKLTFPAYFFGKDPKSYTQIIKSHLTPNFQTQIDLKVNGQPFTATLPVLGEHFSYPAAAAATAAFLVDVPIQIITRGLTEFTPPPHRLTPTTLPSGVILLDDTYNASPQAVTAALNALLQVSIMTKTTPIVVFGQMNELGQYEQSTHEQVGDQVRHLKSQVKNMGLLCLGPATKFTIQKAGFGQYFDNQIDLLLAIQKILKENHQICILIKSSRSWHLDELIGKLVKTSS